MSMLKAFSSIKLTAGRQTRMIQVSARALNVKEEAAPKVKRAPSSAPEGTVLKGLNYMKDGKNPVALADEAYPDWLWEINDPEIRKARIADPMDKKHHKEKRRQAIKADNFIRDRKT